MQAKAAVAQLEPQLNLVKEFLDDYKTEQIVIRNHQGLIYNLNIKYYSWVGLYSKANEGVGFGDFVLNDYFGIASISGELTENVGLIPGSENASAMVRMRSILDERGIRVGRVDSIIKLTFNDSLGREGVSYFHYSDDRLEKYFDPRVGENKFEEVRRLHACRKGIWIFLFNNEDYVSDFLWMMKENLPCQPQE